MTVASNGPGRIGRATLKALPAIAGVRVAANDPAPIGSPAQLLRYDSVYGCRPPSWKS